MVAPALPHSSPLDAGPSPRARFGAHTAPARTAS
jgi:hypothetical protein